MMIFWAQDFLRQKSSETKTWMSFLGYGVSPRVWAMNMIGRWNIWVIWTEHIMSIWTEWDWDFGYDSIRSVCLHETSCIPINCIYSAHLLSKFLELGVGIQNPQNDQPIQFWDLYGVIKMLRWGLFVIRGCEQCDTYCAGFLMMKGSILTVTPWMVAWLSLVLSSSKRVRSRVASPYLTKHDLISKGFHYSRVPFL